MLVEDFDKLDLISDGQLWEVAANRHNPADIRLEAFDRWLFPDDSDPEADPNALGGGRLHELKRRATILDPDELEVENQDAVEDSVPYFDSEGRLIIAHNGIQYMVDSLMDEGGYDGINNIGEHYTTDDKMNPGIDI